MQGRLFRSDSMDTLGFIRGGDLHVGSRMPGAIDGMRENGQVPAHLNRGFS